MAKMISWLFLTLLIVGLCVAINAGASSKNQCFGHPKKPVNCLFCKPVCICDSSGCKWVWVR